MPSPTSSTRRNRPTPPHHRRHPRPQKPGPTRLTSSFPRKRESSTARSAVPLTPSAKPPPPKTAQYPQPREPQPPAPTKAPAPPPSPETPQPRSQAPALYFSPHSGESRNPSGSGYVPLPRPRRHRKPIDRHNRPDHPPARIHTRQMLRPNRKPPPPIPQQIRIKKPQQPDHRRGRGKCPRHSRESGNPVRSAQRRHPPHPPPSTSTSTSSPEIASHPARASLSGSPDHTAKSRSVVGPKARTYRLASRASASSRSSSGRSTPASHSSAGTKVSVLPSSRGPCVM